MKKTIALILSSLMLLSCIACANDTPNSENEETKNNATPTEAALETELSDDIPGDLKYNGDTFRILSRDAGNSYCYITLDEVGTNVVDDAIYKREQVIESRFNIDLQSRAERDHFYIRPLILAGEDEFQLAIVRCTAAVELFLENQILTYDNIPYVNLEKPYWDSSLNNSLTIGEKQYTAISALDLPAYDFTDIMLFNKTLIKNYDLENPFELVNSGKWTFEKFEEMGKAVTNDIDNNGEMTLDDIYGYASHYHTVASWWIAADTLSVKKDDTDFPYLNTGDEKIMNVFDKIFDITWGSGIWYTQPTEDANVPESSIRLFSADRALFIDSQFYFVSALRNMESDFGIIPYPKLDENQSEYKTRVVFYDGIVVPTTVKDLEQAGAILEALSYESYKSVIPAYYDISLKSRDTRDVESAAMLDLIFSTRVIDIGDTTLCDMIRDGVLSPMYRQNNRNLASANASMEESVTAKLDDMFSEMRG